MPARAAASLTISLSTFGVMPSPQSGCPGVVHGMADQHFHRLQLDAARPAPFAKHHCQKFGYLFADLLLDRFGRFFSWGDKVSSAGRARHTSSLVATKARLNSRYF